MLCVSVYIHPSNFNSFRVHFGHSNSSIGFLCIKIHKKTTFINRFNLWVNNQISADAANGLSDIQGLITSFLFRFSFQTSEKLEWQRVRGGGRPAGRMFTSWLPEDNSVSFLGCHLGSMLCHFNNEPCSMGKVWRRACCSTSAPRVEKDGVKARIWFYKVCHIWWNSLYIQTTISNSNALAKTEKNLWAYPIISVRPNWIVW